MLDYIPATKETPVTKDIVWRPVKVWHSASYAGEKLTFIPGGNPKTGDRSGCMKEIDGLPMCHIPMSVTHRIYWDKNKPQKKVSTFLSYPNAMGYSDGKYFWELLNPDTNDTERFFTEEKMEKRIIEILGG